MARSNTEAKYISLAQTSTKVLWIQTLFTELGVSFSPPVIFCDNESVVAFTHNRILHAKTKHMEIDIFFVRDQVLPKQLLVKHIPATDQ